MEEKIYVEPKEYFTKSMLEILEGGKTVELKKPKAPSVVFEYDCSSWFGNSYKITLYSDGKLVRLNKGHPKLGPDDRMCDDKEIVLAQNPKIAADVKQIIKNNKETIRSLPKEVNNLWVLDGAKEKIKFGRKKICGSNILTSKITQEIIDRYKNTDAAVWLNDLFKIQGVVEEIEKVVGDYTTKL